MSARFRAPYSGELVRVPSKRLARSLELLRKLNVRRLFNGPCCVVTEEAELALDRHDALGGYLRPEDSPEATARRNVLYDDVQKRVL